MRKVTTITLLLLALACKKKNENTCSSKNQECEQSLFTIFNRTNDSIFYGIGTNYYEDTLLPGEQRSFTYGKVKVTYNKDCERKSESWSNQMIYSSEGSWGYMIDDCDERAAFEYDSDSLIMLYDVTEN